MKDPKQALSALLHWRAQLEYNAIRRVETLALLNTIVRTDGRPLRGVLLADDLCLTRQRAFYRIVNGKAILISNEDVAFQYDVQMLQEQYRTLQEEWKVLRRRAVS
jgi:hypothetical protein